MGELRPWHIIVLVVVVFVLFGYKKLPDATRALGRSLRILKTEVKSLHDDEPEATAEQPARPACGRGAACCRPQCGSPSVPPVTAGTPHYPDV